MIKIKLSAGSKHSKMPEARAIKNLQHILSREDGYLIPVLFIGEQHTNREIDAVLLLPDSIFFIDFKEWSAQRIEVEGLNGTLRRRTHGAWEVGENTLPGYEYAARIMANKLKRQTSQWLPTPPHIYSVLVFTRRPNTIPAQVSFAGGDTNRPTPRDGVGACNIEQLPQLIAAFRATSTTKVRLNTTQLSMLANFFVTEAKPRPAQEQRRIGDYQIIAEHHVDTFLNCNVYLGEEYLLKEQVWIKEYERVFTTPEERDQRDRLMLRHADVLQRFPQHEHIVNYRTYTSTDFHLYVFLSRKPGAFLSELLYEKPFGTTTRADLQSFPFTLQARLHILGGLLSALDYLIQQPGFEHSAYRDLRPDNIFVQFTNGHPVAQLFNFDCTKIPGSYTKLSNIKSGHKRFPLWDDYASPELLEYIDTTDDTTQIKFTGDIKSDLFSWAIIAWEILVGELPFVDPEAKLANRRKSWPGHLMPQLQTDAALLSPKAIQLIEACLDHTPASRPSLATLKSYFP